MNGRASLGRLFLDDIRTLRRVGPLRTALYREQRRRLARVVNHAARARPSSVVTSKSNPVCSVETFHDVVLVHDGMNPPLLMQPSATLQKQLRRLGVRQDRSVEMAVAALTGGGGLANYFHWLIDLLPRLIAVQEFDDLGARTVIVPSNRLPFQQATLTSLGIEPSRQFVVDRFEAVHCRHVVISSHPRPPGGRILPELVAMIRSALPVPETATEPTPPWIYVRRGDAPSRRFLNERELEPRLEDLGFECISLSAHSFAAQQHLFRRASVIVGPHGAGLTNLLFAGHGTTVLELNGGGWGGPFFDEIARHVGARYLSLDVLTRARISALRAQHASIWMPPKAMDRTVAAVASTLSSNR